MSVREITTDLNTLRRPNAKATLEEGSKIITQLEQSLAASKMPGVGLAAPQIAIHKRVCIVRINGDDDHDKASLDLINPTILERGSFFINKKEGCLSLPGSCINTHRFNEILVKDDLHPAGLVITDFAAVIVQHEVDHLDGILITDRATDKNKIGRNDKCPCNSGLKFKRCHGV